MAASESQRARAAKIANGHAFAKHAAEFGMDIDRDRFRAMIEETVITPAAVRPLANGRIAYWSDTLLMVVILSPGDHDHGTAFRPIGGREYFENLK